MALPRLDLAKDMLSRASRETIVISGRLDAENEKKTLAKLESIPYASSLHLVIDSPGGKAIVGRKIAASIADFSRTYGVPVSSHAARQCSSAALLPFVMGSRRTATASTQFVIHPASLTFGSAETFSAGSLRRIADRLADDDSAYLRTILDAGVRLSAEILETVRECDLVLGADEALQSGLIHEIDRSAA